MLTLRYACPDEAEGLHALTQAAYAEYASLAGPSSALKETPASVTRELTEGVRAVIAAQDGAPVGCVRYRIEGDALYFFRLAVLPEARRQGIASALIACLEEEARQAGAARLACAVRLEVEGNVRLYEKRGFAKVGESSVCRDGTPVPTGHLEKRL